MMITKKEEEKHSEEARACAQGGTQLAACKVQ